jgi:indolepyruvate ferredoxin oxidoreductase
VNGMTNGRNEGNTPDLRAKYRERNGEYYFTGVQALVRVPLEQARIDRARGGDIPGFISGYPGSPLGTLDRELQAQRELLNEWNIIHQPGLNEELAATAVTGSQLSVHFPGSRYERVVGIWYGKAPGLDRAGDAMRHGVYAGTSGGVLALCGDDPSASSSSLPSGSESTLSELHMPVLYPGNVQEVIDFSRHGIALSRASGLWTGMKIVTSVADGAGTVVVDEQRITPHLPVVEYLGVPFEPVARPDFIARKLDIEREIYEARLPLAERYPGMNPELNTIASNPADAWIGIVAGGHTYYETVSALNGLGLEERDLERLGIRLLRLGMLYPLDRQLIRGFGAGLSEIVVIEEKRPFIELWIKDALHGMSGSPLVIGKHDEQGNNLVPAFGALDADVIAPVLMSRLERVVNPQLLHAPLARQKPSGRIRIVLPVRTSYFCSGCPHSVGTKAPTGSLVGSGIGCHGMAGVLDASRVGTITGITHMGGEGAQWLGVAPFVEADHFIQNIGDGTYFHSGALALKAAIAADAHMTYKILYNSAVAMTGGQDAVGALPVKELAGSLIFEGATKVIITSDEPSKYKHFKLRGVEVWRREKIVEAQEYLRQFPGVTVLIHDQQCAAEKRRDRKRGRSQQPETRIVINERVCEGCGDCGEKSACLSVQPVNTEFGSKTRIHQSSCNFDYSCLAGNCPSFMTVKDTRGASKRHKEFGRNALDGLTVLRAADFVEPDPIVPSTRFTIRMPGIGGTGVVTASQILGTAAMGAGLHVAALDQTGLSQKAGPVVSDVIVSSEPLDGTNKAAAGHVDCYLVFDLLVGLTAVNLEATSKDNTVAVVSTSITPSGTMIANGSPIPEAEPLLTQLDQHTRSRDNIYFDIERICEGLFGDTTSSNIMLMGAAFQHGCIPLPSKAIENAIELNGVAVERNRQAFRWGRMLVIDQERVNSATRRPQQHETPTAWDMEQIGSLDSGSLGHVLRVRVPDLVAYQSRSYAQRYLGIVRRAKVIERTIGDETTITEAVARNLHKLMTYKDEYEVARLHIRFAQDIVESQVGAGVRISYELHPPTLKSIGLKRKIRLGPWSKPGLWLLSRGKNLRGSPFDLFGRAEMRRIERDLIDEYEATLMRAFDKLSPETYGTVLKLCELPELIRGYEEVKMANVSKYHVELRRLVNALSEPAVESQVK